MTETQLDYSASGVGKIVSLVFPDNYQEKNPGVPAKSLMEIINIKEVGHLWGGAKNILEFFWAPELEAARVNEALNVFQNKYPDLKIRFTGNGIITM